MAEKQDWSRAELTFVRSDGYEEAVERLMERGRRSFLLHPFNEPIAARLADRFGVAINLYRGHVEASTLDGVIMPPMSGRELDAELHPYLDRPVTIVAPVTDRHISIRPVFVISIPKAGVHFLFHLLFEFGLAPGGSFRGQFTAGHYYFLGREHSHIPAKDFFHELDNEPRGGGDHPFFTTDAIFIYRNPLDVVVSEAFYYVKRDKTSLAYYYEDMSLDERCLRLIRGDPMLPSLRKRMLWHAPWPRFKNVIPLCFEELVGANGQGSAEAQARAIWSLQLKLQVPGAPLRYGERTYTDRSATFRKGQINGHKAVLTAEHLREIRALPQDFMEVFGYSVDDAFETAYLPRFVDAFRRRSGHNPAPLGNS